MQNNTRQHKYTADGCNADSTQCHRGCKGSAFKAQCKTIQDNTNTQPMDAMRIVRNATGVVRTRKALPRAAQEVAENGRKLPEVRMPKYNTVQSTNTEIHTHTQIRRAALIQNTAKYKCTHTHKHTNK